MIMSPNNFFVRRHKASRAILALIVLVGLITLTAPSDQSSALAAGDPVVAAAGDIACDPSSSSFNTGNGSSNSCRQKYTSDLLVNAGLSAVLVLGDNQYYCGGYQAFLQSYDLSWGRVKSITRPSVGNHEYLTSGGTGCTGANTGAAGYFNYFGAAAGNPGQGYYSYDIGTWHLIALNSNCGDAGGCSSSSPQGQWLEADLAAHSNFCTLAYWHIPLFSSGGRASSNSKPFWQSLYNHNADLILSAHDHIYERFAPQTPSGTVDTVRGMREFIVGSGGANHTTLVQTAANSELRDASTFGVLKLTLHPTSYDWRFTPELGKTFTDAGTTACHSQSSDTTLPTAPTNLSANASSPTQVNLTWSASSDNVGVTGYQIYRDNAQIGTSSSTAYSDTGVQPNSTHSYFVVAFDSSGNHSTTSNSATVSTPSDSTPPPAPTNLTATALSDTRVNLAWTASSDNIGVTGYQIFRGGVQIGTATGTTYADTTTQASTSYSYIVKASDAAGNVSGASNTATATTPPPSTVLTFTPSDDTYVQADLASSNFGAATAIGVDNSPIKHILLKFAVGGIGSRTVVSVKLRLYCVDPATFGGDFRRATDTSWSESTVTWNTAPVADTTSLGTLGAVAVGTWYEVDVTPLVTGDGAVGLRVSSTSTNGADYSSKEGAAGLAPQLVVTVR
jgi:chitodextrinase